MHLANFPALVWQDDGQHFIIAKVDGDRFLIQDLVQGRPAILSREEMEARYSGQLILVASRASIIGSLAKFDFTWFITDYLAHNWQFSPSYSSTIYIDYQYIHYLHTKKAQCIRTGLLVI